MDARDAGGGAMIESGYGCDGADACCDAGAGHSLYCYAVDGDCDDRRVLLDDHVDCGYGDCDDDYDCGDCWNGWYYSSPRPSSLAHQKPFLWPSLLRVHHYFHSKIEDPIPSLLSLHGEEWE